MGLFSFIKSMFAGKNTTKKNVNNSLIHVWNNEQGGFSGKKVDGFHNKGKPR